jgi:hypothetical protein
VGHLESIVDLPLASHQIFYDSVNTADPAIHKYASEDPGKRIFLNVIINELDNMFNILSRLNYEAVVSKDSFNFKSIRNLEYNVDRMTKFYHWATSTVEKPPLAVKTQCAVLKTVCEGVFRAAETFMLKVRVMLERPLSAEAQMVRKQNLALVETWFPHPEPEKLRKNVLEGGEVQNVWLMTGAEMIKRLDKKYARVAEAMDSLRTLMVKQGEDEVSSQYVYPAGTLIGVEYEDGSSALARVQGPGSTIGNLKLNILGHDSREDKKLKKLLNVMKAEVEDIAGVDGDDHESLGNRLKGFRLHGLGEFAETLKPYAAAALLPEHLMSTRTAVPEESQKQAGQENASGTERQEHVKLLETTNQQRSNTSQIVLIPPPRTRSPTTPPSPTYRHGKATTSRARPAPPPSGARSPPSSNALADPTPSSKRCAA